MGGVGVVVRDDFGQCLAAFAPHFSYALSALQMELEVCRAGLLIAIHQGWNEVDLESDCAGLVNMVNSPAMDLSDARRILEDCKDI